MWTSTIRLKKEYSINLSAMSLVCHVNFGIYPKLIVRRISFFNKTVVIITA